MWPGQTIDADACRAAVRHVLGDRVADDLRVLPVDRIPLTEQGKPNRPEILRLASASRDSRRSARLETALLARRSRAEREGCLGESTDSI